MTQQSHFWAYTPRKPDLKETRCSIKELYRQSSEKTKREKRFVMSDVNKRFLTRTGFGKLPVKDQVVKI